MANQPWGLGKAKNIAYFGIFETEKYLIPVGIFACYELCVRVLRVQFAIFTRKGKQLVSISLIDRSAMGITFTALKIFGENDVIHLKVFNFILSLAQLINLNYWLVFVCFEMALVYM
jgi:hypothetical protein